IRRGVTYGIRHVDGRCPRLDGGLKDAAEIIPVAAGGILSRELDSWAEVARISNHILHLLEGFLETEFQFMCEMYCRGCQEDMDHRLLSIAYGFPGSVNIAHGVPRQSSISNVLDVACNFFAGLEFARRGGQQAGFDDINTKTYKLLSYMDLLRGRHCGSR